MSVFWCFLWKNIVSQISALHSSIILMLPWIVVCVCLVAFLLQKHCSSHKLSRGSTAFIYIYIQRAWLLYIFQKTLQPTYIFIDWQDGLQHKIQLLLYCFVSNKYIKLKHICFGISSALFVSLLCELGQRTRVEILKVGWCRSFTTHHNLRSPCWSS